MSINSCDKNCFLFGAFVSGHIEIVSWTIFCLNGKDNVETFTVEEINCRSIKKRRRKKIFCCRVVFHSLWWIITLTILWRDFIKNQAWLTPQLTRNSSLLNPNPAVFWSNALAKAAATEAFCVRSDGAKSGILRMTSSMNWICSLFIVEIEYYGFYRKSSP